MDSKYASIAFPTDIVTLRFEGTANQIIVHKDILCHSPWFARKLSDPYGSLLLVCNESKEVGEQMVNWLYFNNLPYSQADLKKNGEEGSRIGTEIVDAYCYAIKLELEDWANALLDAFCVLAVEHMPRISYLNRLEPVQPSDEGLRALLMRLLAGSIRQAGWDRYIQDVNQELSQVVRAGGEFAELLIKCLADPEVRSMLPILQKRGRCKWHVHRLTKKC